MEKEVVKKVMKKHIICSNSEAIEAIEFVMELLDSELEFIEDSAPYAQKQIESLIKSSRNVRDLLDNFEN